jgi:hypothetical protein
MTVEQQLNALRMAANVAELVVHQKHQEDKRKKVPMFFANYFSETVSPVLNYNDLNYFILGWIKCKQKGGK